MRFEGFRADYTIGPPVVCPSLRRTEGAARVPGSGQTNLRRSAAAPSGSSEIACPSDCVYLAVGPRASAGGRRAPAAARHRGRWRGTCATSTNGSRELFFLIVTFLLRYQPPELQPLIDADVAEATAALAATFETAARGVIYEHRPRSLPAERLAIGLKPMLPKLERAGGSPFQRDAAVVLRRVAAAARAGTTEDAGQSPRVPRSDRPRDSGQNRDAATGDPGSKTDDGPRIIIP